MLLYSPWLELQLTSVQQVKTANKSLNDARSVKRKAIQQHKSQVHKNNDHGTLRALESGPKEAPAQASSLTDDSGTLRSTNRPRPNEMDDETAHDGRSKRCKKYEVKVRMTTSSYGVILAPAACLL